MKKSEVVLLMKFHDYPYDRVDYEKSKQWMEEKTLALKNAVDYQVFKAVFDEIQQHNTYCFTMQSLCMIRHSIATQDPFYEKENAYWDEYGPLFEEINQKFVKVLLQSPYLEQIKEELPKTYFMILENKEKTFSSEIIKEKQKENALCSEYQRLIASAQIPFEGEIYTLAMLQKRMQDDDEAKRKKAYQAYWGWFQEKENEVDMIFDQMVHVRDQMAKKLGYDSYTQMSYAILNRFDYCEEDIKCYRKQVIEEVVPVANSLYKRQKERLGKDRLECFDENYEFKSGNPKPKYNKDEMVKRASKLYHELSKESGEFFDFMVEHELLDLEAKKGKDMGGFCEYLPYFSSPFIFSNFNGTSHDVDVLTHEAGHAFQCYTSGNIRPIECIWPGYESCEIHSMSMEFFAWPWISSFFEEDSEKYYYLHLGGAVKFIPYGILVDHFQHEVYNHPTMSIEERKALWRSLERQYLPHKDYESLPFLEKGTWWMKQAHIFMSPFYYVDYTLAQACALQFWVRLHQKDESAWDDYYKICQVGGTLTFREIVHLANLKVPFEEGCLNDVMKQVNGYLSAIHDKEL